MTMTDTRVAPLTADEESLIAKLSNDPHVSRRDVAKMQSDDLVVVRSTLFFVTRDLALAKKQPTLIPVVSAKPKKTITTAQLRKAYDLQRQLYPWFESDSLPEVVAERVFASLASYDGAVIDAKKLERWIVKAEKLMAEIRRNPMLREPSEGNVNWDASGNIGAPGSGRPGGKTSGKKCKKQK